MRLILEAIDEPAFVVGGDGAILDANDVAAEATGVSPLTGRALDSVLGRSVVTEDSAGTAPSSWLGEAVDGRRAVLSPPDGASQDVNVAVAPLATDDGASLVVAAPDGASRDEQQQRTLRQFAEAEALAGLGSWEWDIVANEVRWSEQLCRLVGVDPRTAEPSYEAYKALVHPEDRERWEADVDAVYGSDEPFTTEHRIVRPHGEVRHVRGRAAVSRDRQGQPLRMLGSIMDVTEQHEVQRRKDEFVSMVSHELRTPLTSISGALGLLSGGAVGELPPQMQRMIDIASSNTDRLVRLINDILDLERIESGRAEIAREDLDVERVVADAVALMEPMAEEAQVGLVADTASAGRLVGDADRLQQVLTNLISNAIKYSPAAETVTIAARRQDDDVLLSVTDRGRGIPAEDARRIFERFEQVDSSDSRERGGTGLGLTICKSIAEEHGGSIGADSEVGHGTTVTVRLPAGVPLSEPAAEGPLVLVCDDEADARTIVQASLEANGYRVVTARNGEEALQRTVQERPDVIVLDLVMPGRDGWQTAAMLQRDPGTADVPVVILSGLDAADRAMQGNVTAWVDKAMLDADLVGAVDRALGSPREQAQPPRLLLVEDDDSLAGILAEAFQSHGLAVWVARNGQEGERLCATVEPHTLVLDLLLPDRDGFAVVEAMRARDRVRRTPLIVYSALDLDAQQRERLRLGPTECYTKGRVSPRQLEQRVVELLRGVVPGANGHDEPSPG